MRIQKMLLVVMIGLMVTAVTVTVNGATPKLPSGPDGPGPFGAYYTHLKYTPEWDKPWRVGEYSDVVVQFDEGGHKFVFWRGTSYIPCWVTDKGVWYTNEFVERRGHHSPNTEGCVEPMSDKQCRFSHARIIESNDARVVVHWRYAPVDVHYEHPFKDSETGWNDWVDEYYTIYPNAVGVRKITVYTSRPDLWCEFQESIIVNQPGTLPDENIDYGAVSLANMKGDSHTYVWTEDGGPDFDDGPERANILKINAKGSLKPFALVSPPDRDGLITPYMGHGRRSHFNWWDHWPVSQDASDGRGATSAERPSHSSLCHIGLPGTADAEWKPYKTGEKMITKIMMNGLTDQDVEDLVPLAKSWLSAPELKLEGSDFMNDGYDPTQMAYVLKAKREGDELELTIDASEESPAVHPAFVIKNWGPMGAEVEVNGEDLECGEDYRMGHRTTVDSIDLIVWTKMKSMEPVEVEIEPIDD